MNPLGAFPDLIKDLLPPVVADAIRDTVGTLLGPDGPNPGDPQPPGPPPIPVKSATKEMNAAVTAIDAVLSAIDLALKFSFIIPKQYEQPLRGLQSALRTIRNWLD